MFNRLKADNRQGVIFKHTDARYVAGRPASGGPNLKYKFVGTASFIVGKVNTQRTVTLLLFDGYRIKTAGNVTIPPNHVIPIAGEQGGVPYLCPFWKAARSTSPCISARATMCPVRNAQLRS